MFKIYALIDAANICLSVLQVAGPIDSATLPAGQQYIEIATLDESLLGKTWNGQQFV